MIHTLLETHRHLEKHGFPVPQIVTEGAEREEAYFIERSLGEKRLLELFENDTQKNGAVSESNFSAFLNVISHFLAAQIRSEKRITHATTFADLVQLNQLQSELPQYSERIDRLFREHVRAVSGFPFVVTHGDLNPANMYPTGVIDFEDVASGPLGYDAACAITIQEWFPSSREYEYFERYVFKPDQISRYFAHCDEILGNAGYKGFTIAYPHFEFFRAIWLAAGMSKWLKLQKYRHDLFIEKYLS
ncbi:aminoglycoside phosphotransferase family protein [Candidatus Kaiserbacteria bacterium]|nr:aminoglycoside phosphotransferase family protein [Candidatus Kaiserbacteria bacterium]